MNHFNNTVVNKSTVFLVSCLVYQPGSIVTLVALGAIHQASLSQVIVDKGCFTFSLINLSGLIGRILASRPVELGSIPHLACAFSLSLLSTEATRYTEAYI